jgi:hypothetical protein
MSGTPGLKMAATDRTVLNLWTADAVVLFDWLMSVDLDQVPVRHLAQKQALMGLLSHLDRSIPSYTAADIEYARDLVVARDADA